MEIEEEEKYLNTEKPNQEDTEQLNYLSKLLGIKIKPEELNIFQDMNELIVLINNIKFNDKKKNDIRDTISEEIKNLQNKESLRKLIEEKSKKFSDIVKLNGKTIVYHTAEKDELSETMHAFYFCDKSKQIFSDKQAAELRAINSGYDFPIPRAFVQEEDNISSYSNSKPANNQNDNIENESKLKKKRKPSTSFNKSKTNKKRKPEKNSVHEDYNNTKNNESLVLQDGDYCIPKCKYGKKSKGQPMIRCDKCTNWYHTKCLSFTTDEFLKFSISNWYCPDCHAKINIDEKKI